ncbi:MAG: GldG family protein [Anaerolineae bacterium]|nr:GldG family protein [Anaerolineae bacterium]
MTDNTPNPTNNEQDIFIPPSFMLILAGVGLLVALIVWSTQAEFTVVGWGGLGLTALALVAWALMAPEQVKAMLTGRTARDGGTTVIVTILFIVALSAIYAVVKQQNWRYDLTQRDTFSLSDQSRLVIQGLAVEPNAPQVKILAFYGLTQSSQRDQDSVLFDDYATTSQGKISYEFVDPDRDPVAAQTYSVQRAGQIIVVALNADGQPDVQNAQTVNTLSQEELTNAILRVASSGDFRAYFLTVDGGLGLTDTSGSGLSSLNDNLTKRYNWTTKEVSFFDLTSPSGETQLNDPAADGEALVIVGGGRALPDDQVKLITDYLDNGGDVVMFAAPTNTDGSPNLETADNLNTYLWDHFGLRVNNNFVIDPTLAFQTPLAPVVTDFDQSNFVTSFMSSTAQSVMVFELTHSIDVAPTLPENVVVTELARTSDGSYAKSDVAAVNDGNLDQGENDPNGPFVVMAAAQNTATGAHLVIFGSMLAGTNQYEQLRALNVFNLDVALRSVAWATGFDQFFSQIPQVASPTRPQDTPIFVDEQTSRTINLVVVILLPFGILGVGVLVWFNNRERGF